MHGVAGTTVSDARKYITSTHTKQSYPSTPIIFLSFQSKPIMLARQILTLVALGFVSQPAYPLALDKRDNAQPATPQSTLPQNLTDFVESLRTKYGIPSVGIATVSRANQSAEWQSATGGFGTANVQGDPVTAEVSEGPAHTLRAIVPVVHRIQYQAHHRHLDRDAH